MTDKANETFEIAHSRGREPVSVGDRFTDHGAEWEVVEFTGKGIYSPSGFGGTHIIKCRCHGDLPAYWQKYQEPDGTVEWCGDSVAAAIFSARAQPEKR